MDSSAILREKESSDREDVTLQVTKLVMYLFQVREMYKAVSQRNNYFWAALRKPGGHLTARPGAYSQGSTEEMQLVLQHSWDAWREPPGAIELINKERR